MGDWIQHDKPTHIPQDYEWKYMTSSERSSFVFYITFFCVWMIAAFLLRKNQYFGWMWKLTKLFFIALLIALLADRLKNSFKEWWNKD